MSEAAGVEVHGHQLQHVVQSGCEVEEACSAAVHGRNAHSFVDQKLRVAREATAYRRQLQRLARRRVKEDARAKEQSGAVSAQLHRTGAGISAEWSHIGHQRLLLRAVEIDHIDFTGRIGKGQNVNGHLQPIAAEGGMTDEIYGA